LVFGVNYSRAFKWAVIALLLPLTLLWKVAASTEEPFELKDKLVAFLVDHKYDVVTLDEQIEHTPVLRATADKCRMLVMEVSPDGWQRDLVRSRAQASDDVFFILRGKVYGDQPIWLTVGTGLWSRVMQKLRLYRYTTPVVAVIASEPCHAEQLPWIELRDVEQPSSERQSRSRS
jgi:hypothetical protein